MKTTKKIIDYLEADIKKNFFNSKRTYFLAYAGNKKNSVDNIKKNDKNEELNSFYSATTRWQTL